MFRVGRKSLHESQNNEKNLFSPKYRGDIDGLRALAVLSVVGYHAFPTWIRGGFIGVDIFFVISGYLISNIIFGSLQKNCFSFSGFYIRRVKRIFPALLLVLIASCIAGWALLFSDELKQLGKHIAGSASFAANFVLWSESGYFDNAAETKPLLHIWSLGIEEQFYIFWPLLLLVIWKKRINTLYAILLMLSASLAYNIVIAQHNTTADFYSPLSRFWELSSGSLLAFIGLSRSEEKVPAKKSLLKVFEKIRFTILNNENLIRTAASVAGFILIVAAVLFIDKNARFPGWLALIPTIGAFLILYAGPTAWINRTLLTNRIAIGIGLISYPLYLWHWPLFSFARIIEGQTPAPETRFGLIAASFLLAALTYQLIESPIRFNNRYNRKKVVSLCSLMLAVFCVGAITYKLDGIKGRASVKNYENNIVEMVRTPQKDDACTSYIGIPSPLFPYCRFNNANGQETVAMIGDSHAHASFPGIAEHFERQGKNVLMLANSSCPPFINAVTGEDAEDRKLCHDRIDQIIRVILDKSEIKSVFMTTRGTVYLSGDDFGDLGRRPIKPMQAYEASDSIKKPEEIFKTSLQKTVDILSNAGKTVYYILENPETGIDPRSCIPRPLRSSRAHCNVNLDTVLARQASYREAVNLITGATIIDPLPAFCPLGNCKILEADSLLYADSDHLSVEGSRFLATNVLSKIPQTTPRPLNAADLHISNEPIRK